MNIDRRTLLKVGGAGVTFADASVAERFLPAMVKSLREQNCLA